MAKITELDNQVKHKPRPRKPLIDDIPEAEKHRIIEETGILKQVKIPKPENQPPPEGYFLQAVLFTIPFTLLFGLFEALVYQQYNNEVTIAMICKKMVKVFPGLLLIIFITCRFRDLKLMTPALTVIGAISGCYLLHVLYNDPAFGVMMRCPGLATFWIYCIFQLDLIPCLISLLPVGAYYYFYYHV
ncbi:hypothetical protein K493DRAFT_241524 [Basidiobolus meristosporus CBS 931.73]|uniref:DUF7719 domain-containing protein n=1 Tax=Basidiobolus meristosporus CBS 931.73 TaxID=1314790 RepID=A0A1Y1X8G3_9FUNG|nr:hypothetical protein K493DRAFT_241524 [Basidiobolus meristosporus CBS 931.73]|eukprot:ORX81706.1 hypothetical protein K493DRAFT_241524 [Basidiobolus meristosporus CBS 931.73]